VGLKLGHLLAERGDRARGLIRRAEQGDDLRAEGIEPVVCDMEGACDLVEAIGGADAVVFAAGAGAGSGADRKWTVDYAAAAKLILAARAAGARRYAMVGAMGTQDPPDGDDVFSIYLRAKAKADEELRASGLDWTIVRPGRLTDDPGTGLVTLTDDMSVRGDVPREDVARVLAAALGNPGTIGKTFVVIGGETPVDEAIAAL
jgi:uncharacterized protein YbjT (DUF2867 family)